MIFQNFLEDQKQKIPTKEKCLFHTWERLKGSKDTFTCCKPECTNSGKKKRAELKNKKALCWFCGNAFILTDFMTRRARPHCGCQSTKRNKQIEVSKSKNLMDLVLEDEK